MAIKAVRMFVVTLFDKTTYTTSPSLMSLQMEQNEHTVVETAQLIVDTEDNSWMKNNQVYCMTYWSDIDSTYKRVYHASPINLGKILSKWEYPANPELSTVVVIG